MMQEQLQPTEIDYPSRKAAASALADEAVAALNADLEVQGTASLLCSGGSTPGQLNPCMTGQVTLRMPLGISLLA